MDLIQQFPEAQTFVMPGRDQAILMIHGFTSTPNVYRELALRLSKTLGWEIHVPLLPGHGLEPKAVDFVSSKEWIHAVENKLNELKSKYSKIHLIGLSLGGTLSAYLATHHPVSISSIVMLAPAMFIKDPWGRLLLPLIRFLPRSILKKWILHKSQNAATLEKVSYHSYSMIPVVEVDTLCRNVRRGFSYAGPFLVLVPTKDKTVHPKSARWYFDHVQGEKKKLVELHQSPYVVFLGKENEKIFSEIENFLKSTT